MILLKSVSMHQPGGVRMPASGRTEFSLVANERVSLVLDPATQILAVIEDGKVRAVPFASVRDCDLDDETARKFIAAAPAKGKPAKAG